MFCGYNSKIHVLTFKSFRSLVKNVSSEAVKSKSLKIVNRVVNVAVIGAPNSGKSTLINSIVQRKVCAASNKVHTTTRLVRAMCVQDDTQIIFLDTPGVVTEREQKKYELPASMTAACFKSVRAADVLGVVHDVSNLRTRESLHPHVLQLLAAAPTTPSFLIINKIDRLESKRQLLSLIRNLTNGAIAGSPVPGAEHRSDAALQREGRRPARGHSHFSDVFMVSALNGDGMRDIKDYLINNAKPASPSYSESDWTDQSPERLVEEAVRAKFLDFLAQEIPYGLSTRLEYYAEEGGGEGRVVCAVSVACPSERLARLVRGAGGGRLQQIRSHVRNDLVEMFRKPVLIDIRLTVNHKPLLDT